MDKIYRNIKQQQLMSHEQLIVVSRIETKTVLLKTFHN